MNVARRLAAAAARRLASGCRSAAAGFARCLPVNPNARVLLAGYAGGAALLLLGRPLAGASVLLVVSALSVARLDQP